MMFMINKAFLLLSVLAGSTIVNGCDNSAKLTITVKFDNDPDDISVNLEDVDTQNSNDIELNGVAGETKVVEECISMNKLSKITVRDAGGDGFTDGGYIAIAINDRLIATLSDFGRERTYFVHPDNFVCPGTGADTQLPFVVDIKFDNAPEETTWSLLQNDVDLLSTLGSFDKSILSNGFLTMTRCILETGTYSFQIDDTNGIESPGFYRIFSDYNLLGVGGVFEESETTQFTIDFSDRSPPVGIATQSPTMRPTPAGCYDDFNFRFYSETNDNDNNPCIYLRDRPDYHELHCEDPDIAHYCRNTCQTCTSSCADNDNAKFDFEGKSGRDCVYVRVRMTVDIEKFEPRFCAEGSNVTINCPESCKLCPE
eukprot:CAMPEP_0194142322 /NCGR_PEP_ID=MMETSP0152-20130528/11606_1 /TAXON_ID=1049557 /ORGANISM="Thalassiothrix antarctica, Strain L6-D1" /LENGTH=368 /DNA_ID=CAMNT_0038841241 /DNA_START=81 /DNA_END=1187 /DNA_ORIENTATION=-